MSSPSLPLPKDEWKLKVNAQYQEAIKLLANLVTASLVLPILLVRNFIGLKDNQSIAYYIHWKAYCGWSGLLISLLFGMVFYWSSAKYVKVVCGGKEGTTEKRFESLRDVSIAGMLISFCVGLIFLLLFFTSVVVPGQS